MRVMRSSTSNLFVDNEKAAMGIGTLIIFIAMVITAGVAASVLIQTMNNLQNVALRVGGDVIDEISAGFMVTHVSGYANSNSITQLAIYLRPTAGSGDVDLSQTLIQISDTSKEVILNYTTNVFSTSVSNGIFGTVNSSNLSSTTFGIMNVRDVDSSCTSSNPVINDDDLVVLLINTTQCFSGLATRSEVFGSIIPENGIKGVIAFTTPSSYVDTIIDL